MEQLDNIISRILKLAPQQLHDDLNMENVELWDSLRHMEIVTSIESEFGIEFSYEEITQMLSVGAIRSALDAKIGG